MFSTVGIHRSIKQIWQTVPRRTATRAASARSETDQISHKGANVCICYMAADVQHVAQLSETLLQAGLAPWTFCCDKGEQKDGRWSCAVRQRMLYADFLLVYLSPHLIHAESQRRAIRRATQLWLKTQIGEAYLIPVQQGRAIEVPFITPIPSVDISNAQGIETLVQTIAYEQKERMSHHRIDDFEPEARRLDQCLDLSSIANAYRDSVLFTRKIDGIAIQKRICLQESAEIASAFSYLDFLKSKLSTASDQLLIRFMLISVDVWQALNQFHANQQWLTLRRIRDKLERLVDELGNSRESYAVRLAFVASGWQQILADIVEETAPTIQSPYTLSGPLTADNTLFVGRDPTYATFNAMLHERGSRYHPILLQGRRYIGKSSLLNNIDKVLPDLLFPVQLRMRKVVHAADERELVLNIVKEIRLLVQEHRALELPRMHRQQFDEDPLKAFGNWIEAVGKTMHGKTMLLILDDFEELLTGANQEQYSEEAVRALLRILLVPRTRIKLMFSSCWSMRQLSRWDHTLRTLRPLHLGTLDHEATHRLIHNPVEHFVLQYDPAVGVRIAELTGAHPLLLHLFCHEIILYKNEQPPASRYFVTRNDLKAVMPNLFSAADFFFATIEAELKHIGLLDFLRILATYEEGAVIGAEELSQKVAGEVEEQLVQLTELELIEEVAGGFRFKIELLRRYFAGDRGRR